MHLISSGAKFSKWHSCIDNPLLVLGMMQKMLQNRKFFNRFLLGIEPSSVVPDRMQCHFIVQPGMECLWENSCGQKKKSIFLSASTQILPWKKSPKPSDGLLTRYAPRSRNSNSAEASLSSHPNGNAMRSSPSDCQMAVSCYLVTKQSQR